MVQVLGIKRILFIIILVAANVALVASTYLYAIPESDDLERDLRSTRSQISGKRAEIDRLRSEFDLIQEQKERFEDLQSAGFMSDQNRLVARRRIMSVQKYTKILRAGYDISSADISNHKATDEVGYIVLETPIKIDVDAMDDVDFYSFIYWMENTFPGHMALTNFRLERDLDVNEATLRRIGSGEATVLVSGVLNFVWRTMVPKSGVVNLGEFDSEGF